MAGLRWVNLVFAAVALSLPAAHVLELPNKLGLAGPLWLAVQQHLYRGWGPLLGGPAEIGALLTSLALLVLRRRDPATRNATVTAVAAYAGMIAVFFAFNQPVNEAMSRWTTTLPPDWAGYRRQWEIGHALAAVLAVVGLVGLVKGWLIEHDRAVVGRPSPGSLREPTSPTVRER